MSEIPRWTFGYVDIADKDGDMQELQLIPAKFGEAVKYRDHHIEVQRLQSALATSIAQAAEWTSQANQLSVANNEKAGRIIQLQGQVRLLGWQPIAPDTAWELQTEIGMWMEGREGAPRNWHRVFWPQGLPDQRLMLGAYWLAKGYTHFRRSNPPQMEPKPTP